MSDAHHHHEHHERHVHLDEIPHMIASHMPHIGMRKTKSVLAVLLGFCLWQLIRLAFPSLEVHPIFVYIYGMIEIRDSSEKTVDFGKLRIKATFTALGVGLPVIGISWYLKSLLKPDWSHIAVELGLLMLGVLLTLIIAEKVGCKAFCGLAAAIFIILMVSYANDEVLLLAAMRAFQTLIGVFVAWLINVKLLPYPKTLERVRRVKSRLAQGKSAAGSAAAENAAAESAAESVEESAAEPVEPLGAGKA